MEKYGSFKFKRARHQQLLYKNAMQSAKYTLNYIEILYLKQKKESNIILNTFYDIITIIRMNI